MTKATRSFDPQLPRRQQPSETHLREYYSFYTQIRVTAGTTLKKRHDVKKKYKDGHKGANNKIGECRRIRKYKRK
jgi:hypothetical protein